MIKNAAGYMANVELILAFLPQRHQKVTSAPPAPEEEDEEEIPDPQMSLPFRGDGKSQGARSA